MEHRKQPSPHREALHITDEQVTHEDQRPLLSPKTVLTIEEWRHANLNESQGDIPLSSPRRDTTVSRSVRVPLSHEALEHFTAMHGHTLKTHTAAQQGFPAPAYSPRVGAAPEVQEQPDERPQTSGMLFQARTLSKALLQPASAAVNDKSSAEIGLYIGGQHVCGSRKVAQGTEGKRAKDSVHEDDGAAADGSFDHS
ncbi:hypothetical protein EKO04_011623 [Ascochyta lentis]|uniref:Uncharacterized protein n=1 Tax=Ascochyta lentis TaxID=205686 RepID=A0A8H7MER8_9PLEO|nr:hypothetical protein EKO04_011623 [Ascochyta lentis]